MSETGKTEVNGVNLHYEKVGSGEHVVLLINGAFGKNMPLPVFFFLCLFHVALIKVSEEN